MDIARRKLRNTRRHSTWSYLIKLGAVLGFLTAMYLEISVLMQFDALLTLPSVALTVLLQLAQIFFLMIANFMLFFGPFLLYSRIGLDVTEPGDATWQVKVSDVRGQDGAVGEMQKILKLIESGNKFVAAGGTREKGVLMSGPPGTGKTMLAKAIASELQKPFISTSGASFAGMFLGMDVLKVLMLSRLAKRQAKKWGGCIVFIDEFDAIGQRRGAGTVGAAAGMFAGGGMMALNMLLVVMDGIDQPGFIKKWRRKKLNNLLNALLIPLQLKPLKPPTYNIFFIAATNRPEVLDEAITRPGRFGRKVVFKKPDLQDRKDIAELYFSRVSHHPTLDTPQARTEIAAITNGYSPAAIQQALSVALMYAFEHGRDAFTWDDLREAMATVEVGIAEPIEYEEDQSLAIARHEMGHVLVLHKLVPTKMATRLSIRKRANSLGHMMPADRREEFLKPRSRFEQMIKIGLGSVAAEREFYGENTSGTAGDLHMVTTEAIQMVTQCAMGWPVQKARLSARDRVGLTLIQVTPENLALLSDTHVRRMVAAILGDCYLEVELLIRRNRSSLDRCAEKLVSQKEFVGHEVEELLSSETWR